MGAAGPQGPPFPEFYDREEATDQPEQWARSDRAIILLVIAGVLVAAIVFFLWV